MYWLVIQSDGSGGGTTTSYLRISPRLRVVRELIDGYLNVQNFGEVVKQLHILRGKIFHDQSSMIRERWTPESVMKSTVPECYESTSTSPPPAHGDIGIPGSSSCGCVSGQDVRRSTSNPLMDGYVSPRVSSHFTVYPQG